MPSGMSIVADQSKSTHKADGQPLERIADALEEIILILKRLTFVDYEGYQDNRKPLNLRVFINRD